MVEKLLELGRGRAPPVQQQTRLTTHIDGVEHFNNAGTGSVAALLDANIEKMEDMIALNITALTRLTYAAAPLGVHN